MWEILYSAQHKASRKDTIFYEGSKLGQRENVPYTGYGQEICTHTKGWAESNWHGAARPPVMISHTCAGACGETVGLCLVRETIELVAPSCVILLPQEIDQQACDGDMHELFPRRGDGIIPHRFLYHHIGVIPIHSRLSRLNLITSMCMQWRRVGGYGDYSYGTRPYEALLAIRRQALPCRGFPRL